MNIAEQLTRILSQGVTGNQNRLVEELARQGIQTTQSTVSRALKKINAVKQLDENGRPVYSLARETARPGNGLQETGLFGALVHKILDNGCMIVVHTRPGTAPTVAKVIDDHGFDQIIGTVAGDDTIIIAPGDVKKTRQISNRITAYLVEVGLFKNKNL